LKPALKLFLVGTKGQSDEGDRRILMDDNTGGRVVMMWLSTFQCVGV
jgi:hypothetical protein